MVVFRQSSQYVLLALFFPSVLLLLSGCHPSGELRDFTSDGCSLFPDRSLINEDDWCDCCFEHDLAYWKGGTEEERLMADRALRDCVYEKTGNRELAEAMYTGVRLGGSPYFYNWYRWGYGWDFKRKYGPLTEDEKIQVEQKLEEYFKNHRGNPCADQ